MFFGFARRECSNDRRFVRTRLKLLAWHAALLPLHDPMPERLTMDRADVANNLGTLGRRELHFVQIRAIRVIHG